MIWYAVPYLVCARHHGERRYATSVKLKIDHLVVNYIIVAVVDAAPIRAGRDCCRHVFDVWDSIYRDGCEVKCDRPRSVRV